MCGSSKEKQQYRKQVLEGFRWIDAVLEQKQAPNLNRYCTISEKDETLENMKTINQMNVLTIEQIAYILIQLLQICQEFTGEKGLYFYQDMIPENVFLSFQQRRKAEGSDFKSSFKVQIGSLKNSFKIDKKTGQFVYLYEEANKKYSNNKENQSSTISEQELRERINRFDYLQRMSVSMLVSNLLESNKLKATTIYNEQDDLKSFINQIVFEMQNPNNSRAVRFDQIIQQTLICMHKDVVDYQSGV